MKRIREKRILLLFAVIWMLCCTAAAAEICEHDFQLRETPASCTENGYRGYKCSLCGVTVDYEVLPKLGHSWGGWTVLSHPSCSDFGLQQKTCLVCGDVVQEPMDKLPHEYEVWIQKPTCGRSGYTLHTCVECGHEEKTDRVEALGHDLQTLVVQPTCTKDGYTVYSCSVCTYTRKDALVERTGHLFDSGTVLKEAGLREEGKVRHTCLSCGEVRTDPIPKWSNPFLDVEEASYCRDAVTWAHHFEITTGTDAVHFSPDGICTRAQVVTFLWRWAGKAEPTGTHGFTDVKPGSFYEKAVLWAVEKGITNGLDGTHFGPDAPCTRAQVVTLIHRYQGNPVPKGQMPFVDIPAESYYTLPVLWAYKNGITTGVDTVHFAPEAICTRGQIVTFLFRASQK